MLVSESVGLDMATGPDIREHVTSALRGMGARVTVVTDLALWLQDNPTGLLVVAMGPGFSARVRQLLDEAPNATIVTALSGRADAMAHRRCLEAGANGILTTSQPTVVVELIVRTASAGLTVLPSDIAAALVGRLEEIPLGVNLTPREERILALMVDGSSLTELAATMGLSQRQVRRITKRLLLTIEASNRTHAAAKAARWGLGRAQTT